MSAASGSYLKDMVLDIPKWEHPPVDNGQPDWATPSEGSSFWVPKDYDPPKLHTRVRINAWDGICGDVEGYQVCAPGYLMIWVRPDIRPAWHVRDNPDRHVCLFAGIELEPM